MKTDMISASDLLAALKAHYRELERGHEAELAGCLAEFKSIFLAHLEGRTHEDIGALLDYLRDALGDVNTERWGDTPFRILLEKFPSDSLDSVDVIPSVKEYEIYAGLGLILCEDAVQCLGNVNTADEFEHRFAALRPQLMEAANFATKLKSYWFFLSAAAKEIDKIYDHAQSVAGTTHARKAGEKGHDRHREAEEKVITRFKEGLGHVNNQKFGEWPSVSVASKAIKGEMNFPENVLKSSNAERTIARWITEFLDPSKKKKKKTRYPSTAGGIPAADVQIAS